MSRPPCRRQCRLRQAVAALAAPTDLILAEMTEGVRTVGRLADEVSRSEVVVRPVAEVTARVEEETPRTRVMTADEGVAASTPTSLRS